MIVFALLVIAVCVVVLIKAYDKADEEPTYAFLEEEPGTDWEWPPRQIEVGRWESR